ncbi:FlaA1/EpsC-like NDP-sugar epimerase [Catenulispora sp. GP43]|uniref:polysaccharide biosynthesis protein n=1 Tax=Catenulispora sp. GP43 TaxID=3156263 RepID=UPI00351296BC
MTGQSFALWKGPERPALLRTLIIGAGRAGQALARDLQDDESHGLRPIGFLDDTDNAHNADGNDNTDATGNADAAEASAPPRLGTPADLPRLLDEHAADAVVPAVPGLPAPRVRELTAAAIAAGAVVRYLPWYASALPREATASDLLPLDVRALIDGPEPYAAAPEVKEIVTGRRVLVTGAGGALGAELCRQLHAFNPDRLFLLGNGEKPSRSLLADVWGEEPAADLLDRDETDRAFRDLRPEVVFHAAGLRHPALLERRPSQGVTANVLSTDNLVRAASRHGTERFIRLSTDADPASMLGASHRAAEAVLLGAAHRGATHKNSAHKNATHKTGKKHRPETVFAAVRIGDVLDARDSLLTVLAHEIRAGGPVTVTHPEAARCFATVEEAVALTLEAARMATGGEIYTLGLPEPMRVTEVVSRFTRRYRLPEVPIRYVGQSQGSEAPEQGRRVPTAHPRIFTTPEHPDPAEDPRLSERLEKMYRAADKNRDPKVRQMLLKTAAIRRPSSRPASDA